MAFNLPVTLELRITELKIHDDYKVTTSDDAIAANLTLGSVKMLARDVELAKRVELDPLAVQVAAVREKFRPAEQLLEHAEAVVKRALIDFQAEERRLIAVAQAEQREQIAREQAKLRREAEDARLRAEQRAAELRAAGHAEKAAAAIETAELRAGAKEIQADLLPAAAPAPQPTRLAGFSSTSRWTGEVTDARLFVNWITAHPEVDVAGLVSFKAAGLARIATLYKDKARIPGFKAIEETSAASRVMR